MNLTIVVPTLDRAEFVHRMLDYYAAVGFTGVVLIGDSSEKRSIDIIPLNVAYVDCVGLDDKATLVKLAGLVSTEYVAYIGDDDLLMPSGLKACVEFLDAHPDYVAAGGRAQAFDIQGKGARGKMTMAGAYRLPHLEQASALERLRAHFTDYRPTLFCVHRTEAWRRAWAHSAAIEDRSFAAELLPACMVAAMGKVASLPELYLLRQSGNAKRVSLPSVGTWIGGNAWGAGHVAFVDALAEVVAELDGIHVNNAAIIIKGIFHEGYVQRGKTSLPKTEEVLTMQRVFEAATTCV